MSKISKTDYPLEFLAENFYRSISSASAGVWSGCVLKLHKTYEEHKAKPVPASVKFRLDGPSVSWKVFRRLNLAASFADSFTKDCMVFSYEERLPDCSGQRLFLVTHPQHLWLNHRFRPLEERCTYEVIREDVPCKLYFDLEFKKICNPHKDGNRMTEIFIKCIIASLFEEYNLKFTPSNFLWLDASTEQKYSCHLILQMNNVAFQTNIQAGYFVSLLLENVKRRIETNAEADSIWPSSEELQYLLVESADERRKIFCDEGVYTKNRNFRLFLSTKYGKRAPLLLSEKNQYSPRESGKYKDRNEVIFYDSLITYFRYTNNVARLLTCKQNKMLEDISKNMPSRSKVGFSDFPQNSPSPFPEVDDFVLSIIKDHITTGFIRKWSYLEKEEIIIYEIGNFRFCSNIGRHHKSNNIMVVVDMKRKVYYQRCHDPECRAQGFKSTAEVLPENITSLYNVPDDFFDGDCFTQLRSVPEGTTNVLGENAAPPLENDNHSKENLISDNFLEDICLDSNPFTQLSSHECDNLRTKGNTCVSQELEKSFLEDTSLDDLCMEDLESEFVKATTKNGQETSTDFGDFSINHCNETAPDNCTKNLNSEDISFEDELMMVEAASAVEVTFDELMFSEETIF